MWNTREGDLLWTADGHKQLIGAITFSPNGNLLASGGEGNADQTVKVWDVSSGKLLYTLAGHTSNITSVVFCPDEHSLLSASEDGAVNRWALPGGNPQQIQNPYMGLRTWVWCLERSDSSKLAAAYSYGQGNEMRLWDTTLGIPLGSPTGEMDSAGEAIGFGRYSLVLASAQGQIVELWDIVKTQLLYTLEGHTRLYRK